MPSKTRLLLVAVVMVAVVTVALYLFYPLKQESLQNLKALEACGEGYAVAIVYGPGQEKLAEWLDTLLRNEPILANASFCRIPVDSLGVKLRVLPAVLVRVANTSSEPLNRILDYNTSIQGFHPVKYNIITVFTQLRAPADLPKPVYNVNASLIVVQGLIPEARINTSRLGDERILDMFSAFYAARIVEVREIEYTEAEKLGLSGIVRPTVVAYSSEDLANSTESIVRITGDYYGLEEGLARSLLSSLGLVEVFEVPNGVVNVAGHPSIGHGPVHIAVFEDFACPYCAKFYREVLPEIMGMVEAGRVTLHFMDLIVHGWVERLHALLYCYYNKTGNASAYLEYARKIYAIFETEGSKGLEGVVKELEPYSCDYGLQAVIESSKEALAKGLTGTPSFVLWREGSSVAYYVTGYRDARFFTRIIEDLSKT